MVHCLLLEGIPLTNEIRNILFDVAQKMFRAKEKKQKVKTDDCKGYVYTDWKDGSMGYVFGTVFVAHIDTLRGLVKVNYIIQKSDLTSDMFSGWEGTPAEEFVRGLN